MCFEKKNKNKKNSNYKTYDINQFKIIKLNNKDIYIENYDDNKLIFYHNKQLKTIPLNGWLHPCIKCHDITGHKTILRKYCNKNIFLQICKRCTYNMNLKKYNYIINLIK